MNDPQYLIFRDDDLGHVGPSETVHTLFKKFKNTHEIYNKYNVVHEIGYITKNVKQVSKINSYLKEQNNIKIQFHAHDHCDFTTLSEDGLRLQFSVGVKTIEDTFGYSPTKWYPPFHKWNQNILDIASEYNLKFVPRVISLQEFLRDSDKNFCPDNPFSICYHFWSGNQAKLLEPCIKLYIKKLAEYHLSAHEYWNDIRNRL